MKRNDLDNFLACVEKVLGDKLANNPNSGLRIDGDNKMRYSEAMDVAKRLRVHFEYQGLFSLGICQDCDSFDLTRHQSIHQCLGSCGKSTKSRYETCSYHSGRR